MLAPSQQWAIQVDVTNRCLRDCSNCTRSLSHAREPFDMSLDTFEAAMNALKDFPTVSPPNPHRQNFGVKVVGLIGGEPTLHPDFWELCHIAIQALPARRNRGLWTSVASYAKCQYVRDHFAYINFNPHWPASKHHPVLVAIRDVIADEKQMWELIDRCPYQSIWASSITPKGFFFCEIAGALDMVFNGPGGNPIEPGCWALSLDHFRDQMERWCPRCGGAIPMNTSRHRADKERLDDISPSNLKALAKLGSPRIHRGRYVLFDSEKYSLETEHPDNPLDYIARPETKCQMTLCSEPQQPKKIPGCLFVLESFRRHMDNGRWLFQLGMQEQGYLAVGGGVPNPGYDSIDVAEVMERFKPPVVMFWPRYEWDPEEWGGTEVLPEHCFRNWECLLEMPDVLRVMVFHDAGSARPEQKRWHEAFRPHVYLTWYDKEAVAALAPHVPIEKMLRTHHLVDATSAPVIRERALVGAVSGAYVPDIYPLRTRAAQAAVAGLLGNDVDYLGHPGYHQAGTASTEYVRRLSRYRVALCTASSYKFALRKIFEATLAGCVVVTDLPDKEHVPRIDANLVRVSPDIPVDELRDLVHSLSDDWDLETQRRHARRCAEYYDWRAVTERLATELSSWESR